MAEPLDPVTEITTEPEKGGATKATRGRPTAEFYMQEYGQHPVAPINESYFQHRCHILENELNDAERKARNLVDELLQVKRELSEDRTGLLLQHQQEIAKLKEEHRNDIDEKKDACLKVVQELQKQIDTLEKDMFKKDLEHKNGERSAGNRLIDLAEESAPQLFEALAALFAAYQKNPPPTAQAPFAPSQTKQIDKGEVISSDVLSNNSGASAPESFQTEDTDEHLSALLEKELNSNTVQEEV